MPENQPPADVLVVGGGLLGLCSAHYLHQAGYRVRVLERRAGVGLETSFANAGMVTPSMSDPWNAPGVHWTLLKYLGRKEAPMLLRPGAIWSYLPWGLRFLRFSAPRHFEANIKANFALSSYSLRQIRALRQELGLEYQAGTAGTLKVFRSQASFDLAAADNERLKGFGLNYRVLNQTETLQCEPVLGGNAGNIVGALHNQDDETGDAHLFCRALHASLVRDGVEFSFDTEVTALAIAGGEMQGIHTTQGLLKTQRVVIAAAAWSPTLLRGSGIRLAIKPVKGYSVTAPMRDASLMPGRSIIDNDLHAAITPFDGRIRMAGTAEFANWDPRLDPDRLNNLWQLAQVVNPQLAAAADRQQASNWCGFRPMSADGLPYIGATGIGGLYVNTGHGYLGWTQSAGSGLALSQVVSGRQTDIDLRPYRADRP